MHFNMQSNGRTSISSNDIFHEKCSVQFYFELHTLKWYFSFFCHSSEKNYFPKRATASIKEKRGSTKFVYIKFLPYKLINSSVEKSKN